MGSSGLLSLDLGCRGAVVGLSLLIAGLLLRDRSDSMVARLGAALALGAAASAICSAPTTPRPWEWWSLFFLALSCGSSVVFWLWARAVFDDDFVPRPWHGGLWAAIVGIQLLVAAGTVRWPMLELALERMLSVTYLVLALLAAAQTLATWRADLVATRRRLRLAVLIGATVYIIVGVLQSLPPAPPPGPLGTSLASVGNAFGLFVLLILSGWSLLRAPGTYEDSMPRPTTGDVPGHARPALSGGGDEVPMIDPELLRRLEHLMSVERAYRREGLTIGFLSAELGVPEYRLRRLINEGLGHRNFNAFLNRYRIEEAKAALADAGQNEVPVLTIAMDAGFQSLGPFNRAFKAATDLTPSEFRRVAIAKNAPRETDRSGIGSRT